ncbi:RuBisCO large subunit C-terminal-like domain-containing protein [Gordonia sp. KTR9]|uniref:RuBisCO large subunit C-terminal-like domain-containing protein n=1 Tax=Gordonia sp. KTR9 TaxID=337191 RepID=UPI00027DE4AD|nr:RuBisCO large subunit C-terminal-like domain-containing protein [Gordonia sp. KTR9]AFR49199.1 Ribulose 1,5-bisphosphate carboxylase, large subunit [Gordonia sp. KTR9]
MRDSRIIRCTYYLESEIDPSAAAALLAGEQSSGTFVPVPGESARIRERHAARVADVRELGRVRPSLPSRHEPEKVRAAIATIEFPMENVGVDLASLQTAIAGNLFELGELFACRLQSVELPDEFVGAHAGPAFGIGGTRNLISDASRGALIGTIVKPNVGLSEDEFRLVVRELALASIDVIKDDELMTDPAYLPLERRVAVATDEIAKAEQVTGHQVMYAFNITGDLYGLRRRYDTVVNGGGRCVMLNIPIMGLPALELLRSFSSVPIHGHRAGLAASMRYPGLGVDYAVWQKLARLAGADHLHVSGLGSKFYEPDDEVSRNVAALLTPLGDTITPLPVLSSGQNVSTPGPTFDAVQTTDVLMLAGGGVAAHPDGPAAGVRSLRQSWEAAVDGVTLEEATRSYASDGDLHLAHAVEMFGGR